MTAPVVVLPCFLFMVLLIKEVAAARACRVAASVVDFALRFLPAPAKPPPGGSGIFAFFSVLWRAVVAF